MASFFGAKMSVNLQKNNKYGFFVQPPGGVLLEIANRIFGHFINRPDTTNTFADMQDNLNKKIFIVSNKKSSYKYSMKHAQTNVTPTLLFILLYV